jgi:type VI secretion system protein ImpJ
VSALPPLEAFLYAKTGHPYQLYHLLCAVAGSLAGYAGAILPPVFPAYNHNDLQATFAPVQAFIHKILDNIHESYVAVPFQLEQDRFVLLPSENWLDRYFVIGARGRQGVAEQDVLTWVNDALIGTSSHLQAMREKRVLGAARARINKDESMDLIPTSGMLLFRVNVDPAFIEKNETLEILNTSALDSRHRPAEIIFYARNIEPAQ